MYFIYSIFTNIIFLFSPLILIFRILKKKRILIDFRKNIVFTQKKILKNNLVSAVSVGELMSIIPILNRLENNKK